MTQNHMIRHVSYEHRPENRFAFHPMSIVSIDGNWTIPVSSDEIGHVMRHADSPDIVVAYTHGQLAELEQEGKIVERREALSPTAAALALRHGDQRPTDLPPAVATVLHFRKALCDEILRRETAGEISRSDASLEDAIGKAWLTYDKQERRRVSPDARCGRGAFTLNRPSPATMRRWLVRYEKGGFHSTALLPHYRFSGNRLPRLAVEEQAILTRIAERYASLRKPSTKNLHILMKALVDRINRVRAASGHRALVCPGRTALAAAIRRMDPFHVYAGREGIEKARRKFHIVNRGLEVERPLERIEVDEWRLPLHVLLKAVGVWDTLGEDSRKTVLRIRPWVSTAIDVRTRCVLAVRLIRKTSAASAVAALEMAVTDKSTYAEAAGCRTPWDMIGIHETASADNGSSFASFEWRGANMAVGAEYLFPQAGRPQMRGTEERLYRTLHDGLIRFFDGRTFGDVIRRGEYDSQANATLDFETIGKILTRYVVDVYHNTPHKGLGGQTPRDCWIELRKRYGVRMPPSPEECRAAFGTTLEARIHNDGIHQLGLRYQSVELQRSRAGRSSRTKATFKVSHASLGHISVETPKGWITVPCMREGMENVSLEQWLLACAEVRRKHADAAKVSEPAVLEAIRMVHATAEGARRRAGIANPVLKAEDYAKIERGLFSSFDRAEFEDVEILDVVEAPLVAGPAIDPHDGAAFEPPLEDRSIEHLVPHDGDLGLFLLEDSDVEEDASDEDAADTDTRWKLED